MHEAKHMEAGDEQTMEPICPQLADMERGIPGEAVTPEQLVKAARDNSAFNPKQT